MKITLYIFGAIMVFSFIVYAALVPVRIDSPAIGGMNSNFDIQEVQLTEATYLENADVTTTPGLIQRVRGLDATGDNNHHVFGAFGYYEPTRFWKTIIGVVGLPNDSIGDTLVLYDSSTWNASGGTTWDYGNASIFDLSNGDSMKILGILRTTDTFALAIAGTLPTGYNDDSKQHVAYASPDNYQDFTAFNGFIIHTDGSGPPSVYQMLRQTDSVTIAYAPHFTGMALEAPGQPRVRVIDYKGATSLNEPVEYCYRYVTYRKFGAGDASTAEGDSGLHSIIVYPRNQSVLISGFIGSASARIGDGLTGKADTRIALYRRKIRTQGVGEWTAVERWTMKGYEGNAILDTGQSQGTGWETVYIDSVSTPGQIEVSGDTACVTGANFDSLYWVRYSWYDPVLGIESPMGPISKQLEIVPTADNCGRLQLGAFDEDNTPAPWIRVYQTLADDAFVGSKDTLIWYRVFESPVSHIQDDDTLRYVILGWLSDAQVVNGWAGHTDDSQFYDDNHLSPAADGSGFLRPPFIAGNAIPYSDIAYANGRLWGIGDPLFPSRLYYSEYLRMDDWFVTNYLELGGSDNDEIVAIEVLSGGTDDVLYALKHNAIYAVVGFDVERDAYLSKLKASIGPVDKRSVIVYNNQIFYLGTDMKIYRIEGNQVQEISQRIEDQIDDLYAPPFGYGNAIDSVRTFRLGANLFWSHSRTGNSIVYNVDRGVWQVRTFTNFAPDGFFIYDIDENQSGFNPNLVRLFNSDSLQSSVFRLEGPDYSSDTGGGGKVGEPLVYQTPFIGDGEFLYQIQSIDLVANWANAKTVTIYIVDGEGTFLDSLDVTSDSRSTRLYRVALPTNIGSYLAIRLRQVSTQGNPITIHSLKLNTHRVGMIPLE